MAKQIINIGSGQNEGDGGDKTNEAVLIYHLAWAFSVRASN